MPKIFDNIENYQMYNMEDWTVYHKDNNCEISLYYIKYRIKDYL